MYVKTRYCENRRANQQKGLYSVYNYCHNVTWSPNKGIYRYTQYAITLFSNWFCIFHLVIIHDVPCQAMPKIATLVLTLIPFSVSISHHLEWGVILSFIFRCVNIQRWYHSFYDITAKKKKMPRWHVWEAWIKGPTPAAPTPSASEGRGAPWVRPIENQEKGLKRP